MAHQSDGAKRLAVHKFDVSRLSALPSPNSKAAEVWLLILPFGRTIEDGESSAAWFDKLRRFTESLHAQSIVMILTSAQDAAQTWPQLSDILQFQLWVAIKLTVPVDRDHQQLPENHAALLVLSKYRTALSHTKTRIGYTFCPACDKTTKDYGGKKHTYHEYGTLISDVWRDIGYTPGKHPVEIAERLADIFGLEPYRDLIVVNLARLRSIHPKFVPTTKTLGVRRPNKPQLESRLINGDSLTELRKLADNSIDYCFADPPYNLAKRYDACDDAIAVKDYLAWCDNWLDELGRVLRPGCTCAVLNIPVLAVRHFQHMKRSLTFQDWIAWEALSLPVRMIMPAHYAVVCFSKGNPRAVPGIVRRFNDPLAPQSLTTLREDYCVRQSCASTRKHAVESDREPITNVWWDIHRLKHNSRRVEHPCQLPPALMRRLIALYTFEGEIVLDPFNGAGTTTLCAEGMGRRFIGIELSEKYHELASSRHNLLRVGGDPFAKVNGAPKVKNSRVARIGGVRYEVPKKTLQLEVKRIAKLLGRLPSRAELERLANYPISYYDDYFISWGEVCAAARTTGMSETRNVSVKTPTIKQMTLFQDNEVQDGIKCSQAEKEGAA